MLFPLIYNFDGIETEKSIFWVIQPKRISSYHLLLFFVIPVRNAGIHVNREDPHGSGHLRGCQQHAGMTGKLGCHSGEIGVCWTLKHLLSVSVSKSYNL